MHRHWCWSPGLRLHLAPSPPAPRQPSHKGCSSDHDIDTHASDLHALQAPVTHACASCRCAGSKVLAVSCVTPQTFAPLYEAAPGVCRKPDAKAPDVKAGKEGKPKQKQQQKNQRKGQAPPPAQTAEEMRALRIAKSATLREQGLNPYAYTFARTHMAAALQTKYADIANGEEADAEVVVAVAGRVMARRVMGKLAFVTLSDDSGAIQLYVDKSRLEEGPEAFKRLKNLIDVGDIIGVTGGLRRTDKGELSVVAAKMEVRRLVTPVREAWDCERAAVLPVRQQRRRSHAPPYLVRMACQVTACVQMHTRKSSSSKLGVWR